jgi:hypothetical protein
MLREEQEKEEMAYTHSKYEYLVATNANSNGTGVKGYWAPGYVPHIVRAASCVLRTDATANGVLVFELHPIAGNSTNSNLAVLNVPNGTVAGKVIYKDGLNQVVTPGAEVQANVTGTFGNATTCHICLYVEPTWETPANDSDMVATA